MVKSLEEWKKAVVHLECAADSISSDDRASQFFSLVEQLKNGEITQEEYIAKLSKDYNKGIRDIRYQGTAIFLEHESKRYLLTARHVVEDKLSEERINAKLQLDGFTHERNYEMIFNMIFRVPNFDKVKTEGDSLPHNFLMGLNAGVSKPFTFSNSDIDLAIISLDVRHNEDFANQLMEEGYVPISLDDICDDPVTEGDEIYSIGFPGITSLLGHIKLPDDDFMWSSEYLSLPVFSFGKIAMAHENLFYSWGDVSIYPGNSGGPVIHNGKLIGIVSSQPGIPSETIINKNTGIEEPYLAITRVPFAKVIKSRYIYDLLQTQIEKDKPDLP